MSTRGRIAIKENGKYTYIYNHCDSYIDGLGIILYKFYKDVNIEEINEKDYCNVIGG